MRRDAALILVPSDRMGGAERVSKIVTVELLERGYDVDVLCLSRGTGALFSRMASPQCHVYILSKYRESYGALFAIWLCFSQLRRNRYRMAFSSLVHCNAFLAILRFLKLVNTDRLVCRESTIIAKRFTGLKRLYYKFCYLFYRPIDLIVCQTSEMRRVLPDFAPFIRRNRLLVIPNPVSQFSLVRACNPARSAPSYVSVGRLIPEKGFDILLSAFVGVAKRIPGSQLRIYGEGPAKAALQASIDSLGLGECVMLCGVTDEPHQVMAEADVCVVSSITEGFPNVLLEMMQANCRVVSTLCADGIDEIKGLITCAAADVDALCAALCTVIERPVINAGEQFDAELQRRTPSAFVDGLLKVTYSR